MFRSAHSIRLIPSPARARSFTSCRRVVAISPLPWVDFSCDEQPLVLALLPVERVDAASVQPALKLGPEVGLAPEPRRERDLAEVDAEPPSQLAQRPQLVQLAQAVLPVARTCALRHDEPGRLEVTKHPRRPARLNSGISNAHGAEPYHIYVKVRRDRTGPRGARRPRAAASRPRGSWWPRAHARGGSCPAASGRPLRPRRPRSSASCRPGCPSRSAPAPSGSATTRPFRGGIAG